MGKKKIKFLQIKKLAVVFFIICSFSIVPSILISHKSLDLNFNSITLFQDIHTSDTPLQGITIGLVQFHSEDNLWSSYSTTLNDAIGLGATVNTISNNVTSSLLINYDIIVVGGGGGAWYSNELNDLYNWVSNNNGSVYLLGDDCGAAQVSVSNKFNVQYSSGSPSGGAIIDAFHYLFNGVTSWFFNWPNGHIDLGSSRPDYINVQRYDNDGIIICVEEGNGRILWNVVDMVADTEISENDNRIFGKNSWKWLIDYQAPSPPPDPPPSTPIDPLFLISLMNLPDDSLWIISLVIIINIGLIVAIVFFFKIVKG